MKSLKIALIGYGKMGKVVEKIASERGHSIDVILDNEIDWQNKSINLSKCDVAVEFSTPDTVINNLLSCFRAGIPVVTGTTGWYDQFSLIEKECKSSKGSLFYATNFSIGVNIFFELNRKLSSLMAQTKGYEPEIEEIHHIHKLDAPSGTAISLANDLIKVFPDKKVWKNAKTNNTEELLIISVREAEILGTHSITWKGDNDMIEIKHEAFNRLGLALGAVMAAEFLAGKTGIYTMQDMLKI